MVYRYCVKCPGCGSAIILRLSVGLEIEQPFYFVCKECRAATRGKLVIQYDPSPHARLELQEGELLDSDAEAKQVVNIHPSYPSIPEAESFSEVGGSPFLMHNVLLGEKLVEANKRQNDFYRGTEDNWGNIRRLIGYYLDESWDNFNKTGSKLLEDQWVDTENNLQRDESLHRILDIVFSPLMVDDYYPKMKEEWLIISEGDEGATKVLGDYASSVIQSGEMKEAQVSVFHCLELYVNNRGAIIPGIPIAYYEHMDNYNQLRLFNDHFTQLRDLYVVTYETCHKLLKYVF